MSDPFNQKHMEAEFMEIFGALDKHLESLYQSVSPTNSGSVYVLGDGAPCALDAVIMGSLWAHFLEDPTPNAIMRKNFPFVCRWADSNMLAAVKVIQEYSFD